MQKTHAEAKKNVVSINKGQYDNDIEPARPSLSQTEKFSQGCIVLNDQAPKISTDTVTAAGSDGITKTTVNIQLTAEVE